MKQTLRTMLGSALLLGLFAVAGSGLVAVTHDATREQIAENERQALLASLDLIVPRSRYDNAIDRDTLTLREPSLGGRGAITVYRARRAGEPVAAIFTTVAPDGYSGAIRLLVGVYADGTLAGVRVVAHQETPGLGDNIEAERSPWIGRFAGRRLGDPDEERWKVKKDGGVFDQFTGATITPRAVVRAVYRTLVYFRDHRAALFAPMAAERESTDGHR